MNRSLPVLLSLLLTVAPRGEYRALWGQPDATRPLYDLGRLEGVLDEMRATVGTVGPVSANGDYVQPSLLQRSGGASRWLFWGTLVVAVLALGGLGLRIARQEPSSEG